MEVRNQGKPVRAGSRREKSVPTMMEGVELGQTCRWRLEEEEPGGAWRTRTVARTSDEPVTA
jgi:hypothetical protein